MGKKDVRAAFRTAVFQRDRYTCRVCGRKWSPEDADPALGRLNAHHITDRNELPGGGYVAENGITVCDGPDSCHMKCEQFHITEGQQWAVGLHPDDLYRKVGSSKEKALRASEGLTRSGTPLAGVHPRPAR